MTSTAKLVMIGRNQAIRLPAKLHFSANEVIIEQIGNALWVQPQATPACDLGAWLEAFYASTEALPEDFLDDRRDLPAQERDWG